MSSEGESGMSLYPEKSREQLERDYCAATLALSFAALEILGPSSAEIDQIQKAADWLEDSHARLQRAALARYEGVKQ